MKSEMRNLSDSIPPNNASSVSVAAFSMKENEHQGDEVKRRFGERKTSVLALALLLVIFFTTESSALTVVAVNRGAEPPTIAILDTALDTSLPIFKDRILFEACVTEWHSCPNGSSEMEGPNSAVLPSSWYLSNGFSHGTQMSSLAVQTNPEIKIVFVRIIGATPRGVRQISSENTVERALDWVIRNQNRFGIQAVSMSQGHHRLGEAGTQYCPRSPITRKKVEQLSEMGIPVFFPTGNNGDQNRIDWPACIPQSIAIGSTNTQSKRATFSNYDSNLLDFFAPGQARIMSVGARYTNISGTSASTVIAASQWATIKSIRPELSYQEIYDLFKSTSDSVANAYLSSSGLINLENALMALNGLGTQISDSVANSINEIKSGKKLRVTNEEGN